MLFKMRPLAPSNISKEEHTPVVQIGKLPTLKMKFTKNKTKFGALVYVHCWLLAAGCWMYETAFPINGVLINTHISLTRRYSPAHGSSTTFGVSFARKIPPPLIPCLEFGFRLQLVVGWWISRWLH